MLISSLSIKYSCPSFKIWSNSYKIVTYYTPTENFTFLHSDIIGYYNKLRVSLTNRFFLPDICQKPLLFISCGLELVSLIKIVSAPHKKNYTRYSELLFNSSKNIFLVNSFKLTLLRKISDCTDGLNQLDLCQSGTGHTPWKFTANPRFNKTRINIGLNKWTKRILLWLFVWNNVRIVLIYILLCIYKNAQPLYSLSLTFNLIDHTSVNWNEPFLNGIWFYPLRIQKYIL